MKQFDNLINGEWRAGHGYSPNVNPSNLADVLGEYAQGDAAQVDAAVAAATAAFPAWSTGSVQARCDALDKIGTEILARKEELGTLLAREEGKTRPEGIGEATRAGHIFKFFAGECLRLAGETLPSVRPGIGVEITREPVGVVGLITPWNFPIAIPAWKIAPALAFGNCVVLKPADLVPGCAWALAEIISRSGIPAGVFNLVMGRGSVIGNALVQHAGIHAVSFTGSTGVGRGIALECVKSGKKVQLEMGGKNPQVVLDDADLAQAVELSVQSAFYSTGQRCTASSRLIVTEGIYLRFIEAMKARMAKITVGDALAQGTDIGPVSSQSQLEQDLGYIDIGKGEGATLAVGGERLKLGTEGFYMAPRALQREWQGHAHQPRGDLRPRGQRDPREGLRGGAGHRQRHRVRPLGRHRHHQPEVRHPLQALQPGRHGDGQPAHGGRGLPRALRRAQGQQLRPARAGPLRAGVLHDGEDGVHTGLSFGPMLGP